MASKIKTKSKSLKDKAHKKAWGAKDMRSGKDPASYGGSYIRRAAAMIRNRNEPGGGK